VTDDNNRVRTEVIHSYITDIKHEQRRQEMLMTKLECWTGKTRGRAVTTSVRMAMGMLDWYQAEGFCVLQSLGDATRLYLQITKTRLSRKGVTPASS